METSHDDNDDSAVDSPALDFISPLFDPQRALRAFNLQPPDITAEPLPDIGACIADLPEVRDAILTFADEENDKEMQGLEQNVGFSQRQSCEREILTTEQNVGSSQPQSCEREILTTEQNVGSLFSPFSLDFFSPDFDALEALYTKGLDPPNPRVRPLDNLSSCRRILPEEVPESVVNIPHKAPRSADSILAQERAKAHKSVLLLKAAERERQVKIFDKITEKLKHGPLGLLAECYYNHVRIKVWTRHSRGIRGSLTGYLIAFDKHLNMVLHDIDEQYSVRRWVSRLVHCRGRAARACVNMTANQENCEDFDCEKKDLIIVADEVTEKLKELRLFPKLEHRRRHLKQVFLRGDSVVMVQKL